MVTSVIENTSSPAPIRSLFANSSRPRVARAARIVASMVALTMPTRANAEKNQGRGAPPSDSKCHIAKTRDDCARAPTNSRQRRAMAGSVSCSTGSVEFFECGDQPRDFLRGVVMQQSDAHHARRLHAESLGQRQRVVVAVPGEEVVAGEVLDHLHRTP